MSLPLTKLTELTITQQRSRRLAEVLSVLSVWSGGQCDLSMHEQARGPHATRTSAN